MEQQDGNFSVDEGYIRTACCSVSIYPIYDEVKGACFNYEEKVAWSALKYQICPSFNLQTYEEQRVKSATDAAISKAFIFCTFCLSNASTIESSWLSLSSANTKLAFKAVSVVEYDIANGREMNSLGTTEPAACGNIQHIITHLKDRVRLQTLV